MGGLALSAYYSFPGNNSSCYCYWRTCFVFKKIAPVHFAFFYLAFFLHGKDGCLKLLTVHIISSMLYVGLSFPCRCQVFIACLYVLYWIKVEKGNYTRRNFRKRSIIQQFFGWNYWKIVNVSQQISLPYSKAGFSFLFSVVLLLETSEESISNVIPHSHY